MSQPFIGPLPFPDLPAQPKFPSWCTNWGAYDVPRLWDVLRPENDKLGWEQVTGFRHLADLLVDHYRRLRSQHDRLYSAWQSPAGEVVLSRVDGYAKALLSDAHCAATTATALDAIMATYASARTKMEPLAKEWDNVTTDWKPEWWDHAAEKLNNEGHTLMVQTDEAVRDHRTKIIIPDTSPGHHRPINTDRHTRFEWRTDEHCSAHPTNPGLSTRSNYGRRCCAGRYSNTCRGAPRQPGVDAANSAGQPVCSLRRGVCPARAWCWTRWLHRADAPPVLWTRGRPGIPLRTWGQSLGGGRCR